MKILIVCYLRDLIREVRTTILYTLFLKLHVEVVFDSTSLNNTQRKWLVKIRYREGIMFTKVSLVFWFALFTSQSSLSE